MYYKSSVSLIQIYLSGQGFIAKEHPQALPTGSHLLWMCEQIETMSKWSLSRATKAGRWIGWMFASLEAGQQNGSFEYPSFPWTNELSRSLAKKDVELGYDFPIWLRWLNFFRRR